MKKITSLLIVITFLSGCVESMALLGPATTGAGSGKIAQSAVSSAVSYGVKNKRVNLLPNMLWFMSKPIIQRIKRKNVLSL